MNDIAMHRSDRGILIGANGTGKSTLAEYVLASFRDEYPDARIAVLDTKPRWRAEYMPDGRKARKLYKRLAKGDTIPGSMHLSRAQDWPLVWDRDINPSQSVIVQRLSGSMADNVRFQVGFLEKFFSTQDVRRPSLVYLDEGMDFFTGSSSARGGSDIVQRCFRAGRERGLATLIGVQRPISINLQCLTETSWCALFRINFQSDVKRLYEMGWPHGTGPPTYEEVRRYGQGLFRLWRDGQNQAPFYRLGKVQHERSA
jgi:hypothetical protein